MSRGYLFLPIAVILACVPVAHAYDPIPGSPLALGERPRLFFTGASLADDIVPYIETFEALDVQTFVTELDGDVGIDWTGVERPRLLADASNFAFLARCRSDGLLTSTSFAHDAATYADEAIRIVEEIDRRVRNEGMREFRSSLTGSDGGYIGVALSTVYDWCHPDLTLTERTFIADLFVFLKNAEASANCYEGEQFNYGNDWNSQCWEVGFFGGVAMYGDADLGAALEAEADILLDSVQWFVFDQVFDLQEHQYEGLPGNGEGTNYHSVTLLHQSFQANGLGPALGIDFYESYGVLEHLPLSLWFEVQPMFWDDGATEGWLKHRYDDVWLAGWSPLGNQMAFSSVISQLKDADPLLAGSYRWLLEDSRCGSVGDFVGSDGDLRIHWLWYKFLWGIRDVAKHDLSAVPISSSQRLGMGEVVLQSDLETEDATKIVFYTPKWHTPLHDHVDDGGFEIFKRGLLAINDGGNWKSSSPVSISPPKSVNPASPVFHNVMALYDPGVNLQYQHSRGTDPDADSVHDPANQEDGANHIGEVPALRFEDGVFDFVEYDYTRSFKGAAYANDVRRSLLYLRDPAAPDYSSHREFVVVFDRVDADADIERRFLLKTADLPVVVDGAWTANGTFHWTSTGSSQLDIAADHGTWDARMFLKTLAPDAYHYEVRGGDDGSDRRWFVDAEGNSLHAGGSYSDAARAWVGAHRLEIHDDDAASVSHFLNVMQIGDGSLTSMAATTRIDGVGIVGAEISPDRVAVFNRDTERRDTVTYSTTLDGPATHVVTGLAAGIVDVTLDGSPLVSTEIVADDGVLTFDTDGAGTIAVVRSDVVGVPAANADIAPILRVENPGVGRIGVDFVLDVAGPVRLDVFSVHGRRVRTLAHGHRFPGRYKLSWDGRDVDGRPVGAGMYLVRLIQGDDRRSRRVHLVR